MARHYKIAYVAEVALSRNVPPPDPVNTGIARGWLASVAKWFAVGLPVLVALGRTGPLAQWDADDGVLRDYALMPWAIGGGVSTALGQLASVIPLGTIPLRLTLVSLVALAVTLAAFLGLLERSIRLLEDSTTRSVSVTPVAALFTLLVGLSAPFQLEATRPGSTLIAVALALFGVRWLIGAVGDQGRVLGPGVLALGPVVGATLGEQPGVGMLCAMAIAVGIAAAMRVDGRFRVIPRRVWLYAGLLCVLCACVVSAPGLIRHWVSRSGVTRSGLAAWFTVQGEASSSGASVFAELGYVAALLCCVGIVVGLFSRRRWVHAPMGVCLLGLLASSSVAFLANTRLVGIVALATFAAVAFSWGLSRLRQLPFGKAATAMVLAAQASIVALISEDAGMVADRASQSAAAVFTDQSFATLPPRAAVVVHDQRLATRLLTAQMVFGVRPDALVVPSRWLSNPKVALRVLAEEPETETLVRTMMLTRRTDEFALARVADRRPLRIEPKADFSRSIQEYTLPDGVWLAFSPHPTGSLDRRAAVARTLPQIRRLREALPTPWDPITAGLMAGALGQHADVLVDLKEGALAAQFFAELRAVDAAAPARWSSIESRVADAASRMVDWRTPRKSHAKVIEKPKRAR